MEYSSKKKVYYKERKESINRKRILYSLDVGVILQRVKNDCGKYVKRSYGKVELHV